jgi:hypothetical protein
MMEAYLAVLLEVDDVACPVLDDQLGQLGGQESDLRQRLQLHKIFYLI